MRLVTEIVTTSHGFPRPDATLARNQKSHIWPVLIEDEIIQECLQFIESVIDQNMAVIKNVLLIYDKYAYLLTEMKTVEKFIRNEDNPEVALTRQDYQNQIKKYTLLYESVKRDIPFYVRLSMVNIDGSDVKKQFLSILDNINNRLVLAIYQFLTSQSKFVKQRKIDDALNKISKKAENEHILVDIETEIDSIRSK